jgi:hypothetical protein
LRQSQSVKAIQRPAKVAGIQIVMDETALSRIAKDGASPFRRAIARLETKTFATPAAKSSGLDLQGRIRWFVPASVFQGSPARAAPYPEAVR